MGNGIKLTDELKNLRQTASKDVDNAAYNDRYGMRHVEFAQLIECTDHFKRSINIDLTKLLRNWWQLSTVEARHILGK